LIAPRSHTSGLSPPALTAPSFYVRSDIKAIAPAARLPCAACVPSQPNGAELRYPRRNNDDENPLTQHASGTLGGLRQNSIENRLARFVISSSPVRLRRVARRFLASPNTSLSVRTFLARSVCDSSRYATRNRKSEPDA